MMNPIQLLSSQPWIERLGWTLVHFFWQGLLIAILYAGTRRGLARRSGPNTRYLLACAALAAMIAAPLVTWALMAPSAATPDPAYRIQSTPPAAYTITAPTTLPTSVLTISGMQPARFLPWIVIVWLVGAVAFWVRLAGGWVVAARMRSMLVRRAPPEWQQTVRQLGARIGLSRPVQVLVSGLVQAPAVVGWLRPIVLVPVGALSGLPAEYVEALLAHELAHIRRHDYLVNMLQSVAEALLFYHPAVWWVSGHIRSERELCCDDVAVEISGDVETYARALCELESSRPAHLTAALAANGGSLADRIARLLGQSRTVSHTRLGPGVVTVAILLMLAAYGLFGQSGARPEFQAASIKRNLSASRLMGIRPQPGGRLIAENAPLMLLIQNAYAVQAFQVVGGPAWINSEGFDIEAKPEGNVDRKQMWLMVQTLLADRFKLALHRETRDLPLYALTVTKGGLKQPPKQRGCVSIDTSAPLPSRGPIPQTVPCGSVLIMGLSPGLRMDGGKVPMAELIRVLAMVMGRPVLDRTEFTGEFDVHLEFTPDENTMGLPGSGGPGDPGGLRLAPDPSRPDIFAALQEQLGLKLASAKGPVEVLVIDHVERPTAN